MTSLCATLQQIWHEEIPISKAMGIEVTSFEEHELAICADLAPNINVHGTAFAGSLYAVAALCGWGATYLSLLQADRSSSIVIAHGEIDYALPVSGPIEARCTFTEAASLASITPGDKRRFNLSVRIGDAQRPPATFNGVYAIRYQGDA